MFKKFVCALTTIPLYTSVALADPIDPATDPYCAALKKVPPSIAQDITIPDWCLYPDFFEYAPGTKIPQYKEDIREAMNAPYKTQACQMYASGQYTGVQIENAVASEYYLQSTLDLHSRDEFAALQGATATITAIDHYKKTGNCNFN